MKMRCLLLTLKEILLKKQKECFIITDVTINKTGLQKQG